MRVTTADKTEALDKGRALLVCLLAWLVPGAGHIFLRRVEKGLVFLVILPLMFVIGLALQGRLPSFTLSQPLVALAALATYGDGLPYFFAWFLDLGSGNVVAATYEYGNAFLIVAGLLNVLVVLDAWDIALGRK